MKRFLFAITVLLCSSSCMQMMEEPALVDGGVELTAVSAPFSKTVALTDEASHKLSTRWVENDQVSLSDDSSTRSSVYALKADDISSDGAKSKVFYSPAPNSTCIYAAYAGKSQIKWNGDASLTIDNAASGSFSEANIMVAQTSVQSSELPFRAIAGMLEFSVRSTSVKKVIFKAGGDVVPSSLNYSFVKDTVTVNSWADALTFDVAAPATLYVPVIGGRQINGFAFTLLDSSDSVLAELSSKASFTPACGQVVALGTLDSHVAGHELALKINFKTDETLNDIEASGTYWPFKEGKGSSGTHVYSERLHLLEGGYAMLNSTGEYYLNSKNGLKVYPVNSTDFLEIPTFSAGRIKEISLIAGKASFAPSFVDSKGEVLDGGVSDGELEPGRVYTYKFPASVTGEPCRIQFNKSVGSCDVIQIIAIYDFVSEDDATPQSTVASVNADASVNSRFGSGTAGVSASFTTVAGASSSEIECGVEYRDFWISDAYVQKRCTPDSFACEIDNTSCDRYLARAWAASPKGWREYSESVYPYRNAFTMKFWVGSALNKPLNPNFKSGRSSASAEAGAEVVRTLVDNSSIKVGTFVPRDGTNYYIDNNSSKGVRVSSAGTLMSPLAYFRLPSLAGHALSSVSVKLASDSAGSLVYICSDPSDAAATMVSGEVELTGGKAVDITCACTTKDKSYYLVFPENKLYYIHEITAAYSNGGEEESVSPEEEEADDASPDPSGVFDYSRLNAMGHPRLLIDAAGFEKIRRVVTSDRASNRFLCSITNDIIAMADRYVADPSNIKYNFDGSGKRILFQSRNAFRELSLFSYSYKITGNRKYLQAAKDVLATVCAFPEWNPSHFLDVAEMTLGVSIAYDWLYDQLTLQEKQLIHSRLVDYALVPSQNADYHSTNNNWNQVCNAGMTAAAVALYEKDKNICFNTIEKAIETNRRAIDKIYNPDGNYCEGYGYWGYGSGFQAVLMKTLQVVFGSTAGLEDAQGLKRTGEFMLFMVGPCGPFSYSDGGSAAEEALHGMWWFAQQAGDPSLLRNEMRSYKAGLYGVQSGAEAKLLPLVAAIVRDFNVDGISTSTPSKKIWHGDGTAPVVMVHTGWNFDENDHYLGIKAGQASTGHGHMDAGSFVYDALGHRWSADPKSLTYDDIEVVMAAAGGDFWDNRQRSMRWDMLQMNSLGHSTISVDANDGSVAKTYPTDHCVSGRSEIKSVIETATELGAVVDISDPLRGQVQEAQRTIKLVNEKDLVIIDRITAKTSFAAPVKWRMATPASISIEADGEVLSQGGQTMYLKAASSDSSIGIEYINLEYQRPANWNKLNLSEPEGMHLAGFDFTVPAGATVTITVTLSPEK